MRIYANNKVVDSKELSEIFEPGFLFGWGIFEPLRVYAGKPAFLDEHVSRLNSSCRLIGLEAPQLDWGREINNLLKENKLSNAYIRLTVYKNHAIGVIIYADDFKYYASDAYANGFTTLVSAIRRDSNDPSCRVKTISYLNNRLAWAEAQAKGKDEALMLNLKGNLAGGARSNLFVVKKDLVTTPLLREGAFCGITRLKVIKALQQIGLKAKETIVGKKDLLKADEAFLTSALLEVMPLVACDGKKIGTGLPGKVALAAREQYLRLL